MCVGPCVPVEGQLGACSNAGILLAGGCALVTVDVVSARSCGLNEAVVLVLGIPASSLSPLSGGQVVPDRVGSSSPDVVGRDAGHEAVSRGGVEQGSDSAEKKSRGKHLVARVRSLWSLETKAVDTVKV